jgi:hypothetical protein
MTVYTVNVKNENGRTFLPGIPTKSPGTARVWYDELVTAWKAEGWNTQSCGMYSTTLTHPTLGMVFVVIEEGA